MKSVPLYHGIMLIISIGLSNTQSHIFPRSPDLSSLHAKGMQHASKSVSVSNSYGVTGTIRYMIQHIFIKES